MYKSIKISLEESKKIRDEKRGWELVCEQQTARGENRCYWNNLTGELIWEFAKNHEASYNKYN